MLYSPSLTEFRRYVSELLYIHTKLMIVDDQRVIVSLPVALFLLLSISSLVTYYRWARPTSTIGARRYLYSSLSGNMSHCSQGDGDSEIALVVEDTDTFQSTMNSQPHTAARFAATLRRKLFRGKMMSHMSLDLLFHYHSNLQNISDL
jgi:phospholipase D1/2